MALPQSRPGSGFVLSRVMICAVSAAGPVNRDPREQRIVPGEPLWEPSKPNQRYEDQSLHEGAHVLRPAGRRKESSGR